MLADRTFYSVEEFVEHGECVKYVHISGCLYADSDNDWFYDEYVFWYIEITELREMLESGEFDELIMENVRYSDSHITKQEAIKIAENYFGYRDENDVMVTDTGTSLDLWEVTKDTPVGDYYWERGWYGILQIISQDV